MSLETACNACLTRLK